MMCCNDLKACIEADVPPRIKYMLNFCSINTYFSAMVNLYSVKLQMQYTIFYTNLFSDIYSIYNQKDYFIGCVLGGEENEEAGVTFLLI